METGVDGRSELTRLGDEYFRAWCEARPFDATVFGVPGYDGAVPDPSREADEALRSRFAGLATELATVDPAGLPDPEERISHAMLSRVLADEQAALAAGLGEVSVSAGIAGALSGIVSLLPTVSLATGEAAEAYLSRLAGLGGFFDALGTRQVAAAGEGRTPTALGVRQAVTQLDAYLAGSSADDPLLRPRPAPEAGVDGDAWVARAGELLESVVRPALARYREALAERLAPVGRPDDRPGVCHVPGGAEGYLALARAHTTTDLSPEEIHQIGLRLVAELREEYAQRGGPALGTSDVPEVLGRLRDDPSLRFGTAAEIVDTVAGALRRAEQALPDWFRDYQIVPCAIREMDPVEAENSTLAYYLPPAADGSRPGTHVVNTHRPELRPRFEYEALAFHESVPGHHLQIAVAQTRTDLPDFRRFTFVTAHGEGWGLYTERLCDEMGLYSDELSKLGMVSFDAWRAGRLVVDTGMHHLGWSRDQAIAYLREHTALSEVNIVNEVDRYIAMPGQALAYMVGRLRLRELRDQATRRGMDVREFHHQVLGHGSLPLDTLATLFA